MKSEWRKIVFKILFPALPQVFTYADPLGGLNNIQTNVSPIVANIPDLSINGLLFMALNVIIGVLWGSTFIAWAWACYMYIMSRGDPKATMQAWNTFIYGVFAAAVSFLVIIARIVALNMLGVSSGAQNQYDRGF